jgi:ubiquinone/menaquinone biosynthesis C-methylase UbiE
VSNPKIFSRLYDPVMALPENLGLQQLRREAFQGVKGRVLELGIGTGRNIPLYPATVAHLVGIDPDQAMLDQAAERARKVSLQVDLIAASAEDLPFEENSFDAVVATLVFCTIPDPVRALREAHRVLKPDGSFHLLEHVKVKRQPIAWIQGKATPLWKHLAGGCHLDRDTLGMLQGVGFEVERINSHLRGLFLDICARAPEPT